MSISRKRIKCNSKSAIYWEAYNTSKGAQDYTAEQIAIADTLIAAAENVGMPIEKLPKRNPDADMTPKTAFAARDKIEKAISKFTAGQGNQEYAQIAAGNSELAARVAYQGGGLYFGERDNEKLCGAVRLPRGRAQALKKSIARHSLKLGNAGLMSNGKETQPAGLYRNVVYFDLKAAYNSIHADIIGLPIAKKLKALRAEAKTAGDKGLDIAYKFIANSANGRFAEKTGAAEYQNPALYGFTVSETEARMIEIEAVAVPNDGVGIIIQCQTDGAHNAYPSAEAAKAALVNVRAFCGEKGYAIDTRFYPAVWRGDNEDNTCAFAADPDGIIRAKTRRGFCRLPNELIFTLRNDKNAETDLRQIAQRLVFDWLLQAAGYELETFARLLGGDFQELIEEKAFETLKNDCLFVDYDRHGNEFLQTTPPDKELWEAVEWASYSIFVEKPQWRLPAPAADRAQKSLAAIDRSFTDRIGFSFFMRYGIDGFLIDGDCLAFGVKRYFAVSPNPAVAGRKQKFLAADGRLLKWKGGKYAKEFYLQTLADYIARARAVVSDPSIAAYIGEFEQAAALVAAIEPGAEVKKWIYDTHPAPIGYGVSGGRVLTMRNRVLAFVGKLVFEQYGEQPDGRLTNARIMILAEGNDPRLVKFSLNEPPRRNPLGVYAADFIAGIMRSGYLPDISFVRGEFRPETKRAARGEYYLLEAWPINVYLAFWGELQAIIPEFSAEFAGNIAAPLDNADSFLALILKDPDEMTDSELECLSYLKAALNSGNQKVAALAQGWIGAVDSDYYANVKWELVLLAFLRRKFKIDRPLQNEMEGMTAEERADYLEEKACEKQKHIIFCRLAAEPDPFEGLLRLEAECRAVEYIPLPDHNKRDSERRQNKIDKQTAKERAVQYHRKDELSIRAAAEKAGVSEKTLRRYLAEKSEAENEAEKGVK